MSTDIIVSYDGTPNDDDALALGKALAGGGRTLALAYVRHSREFDPRREELASHDAQRRLESGANWLGDPDIPRHVVISASTGEGLAQLAQSRGRVADRVRLRLPDAAGAGGAGHHGAVPAGGRISGDRRSPGGTEDRRGRGDQLDRGGELGRRRRRAAHGADARAALGADVVSNGAGPADMIVVASQAGGPDRRITLGGSTRSMLNSALGSVIVLPRGTALTF